MENKTINPRAIKVIGHRNPDTASICSAIPPAVSSGFSSRRLTTRERTDATPLASSFAREGLR